MAVFDPARYSWRMTTPPLPRPSFTISEAASLVGVSRSTIRRRREKDAFAGAYKTIDGEWKIPLVDLLANGFTPLNSEQVHDQAQGEHVSSVSGPTVLTGQAQVDDAELVELRQALARKEMELAVERARVDGLESTLSQAIHRAANAEKHLLMLEAGKGPAIAVGAATGEEPAETPAKHKGFWASLFSPYDQ
jgi:hypothetical protein